MNASAILFLLALTASQSSVFGAAVTQVDKASAKDDDVQNIYVKLQPETININVLGDIDDLLHPTRPTHPTKPTHPTRPTTTTTTTSTPSTITDLVPGFGFYKFHEELVFWDDAVKICESEGGYMLILRSTEEFNALIKKYYTTPAMLWLHYGAHHRYNWAEYVTIFNETVETTGFNTWYLNPRANNVPMPVVSILMRESSPTGLWQAYDLVDRQFICKRDL